MKYPHAPDHMFSEIGTYMVTGATYEKKHFFKSSDSLEMLQENLFELSQKYQWKLEAWAIFSNHYHFVARSPENPETLPKFINALHRRTAIHINKIDGIEGRKVWYQYWDSKITIHGSYLARLKYVHLNPVRHGLVYKAELYNWCSAAWFEMKASRSFRMILDNIDCDSVNIYDEF